MDHPAPLLPPNLDEVRLLDRHAVARALGYPSVRGLERDVRLGRVPAPHLVLGSKARWRADDIKKLIERITGDADPAKRDAAVARAKHAAAAVRRQAMGPLPRIDPAAIEWTAPAAAHAHF
jgi:hypothetical protein